MKCDNTFHMSDALHWSIAKKILKSEDQVHTISRRRTEWVSDTPAGELPHFLNSVPKGPLLCASLPQHPTLALCLVFA